MSCNGFPVPSMLGAGDGTTDNHSPLATFDDAVVPDGAAVLAELALRRGRHTP